MNDERWCIQCGAQLRERFCGSCGTDSEPLGGVAQLPPSETAGSSPIANVETDKKKPRKALVVMVLVVATLLMGGGLLYVRRSRDEAKVDGGSSCIDAVNDVEVLAPGTPPRTTEWADLQEAHVWQDGDQLHLKLVFATVPPLRLVHLSGDGVGAGAYFELLSQAGSRYRVGVLNRNASPYFAHVDATGKETPVAATVSQTFSGRVANVAIPMSALSDLPRSFSWNVQTIGSYGGSGDPESGGSLEAASLFDKCGQGNFAVPDPGFSVERLGPSGDDELDQALEQLAALPVSWNDPVAPLTLPGKPAADCAVWVAGAVHQHLLDGTEPYPSDAPSSLASDTYISLMGDLLARLASDVEAGRYMRYFPDNRQFVIDEAIARCGLADTSPAAQASMPATGSSEPTVPPATFVPVTESTTPGPIGYEEGDGVWWFDEGYKPAPDFLKDVNDKWGNGFVPTPYSYCALPGSFSAPGEWGTDGEVTLGPDPLGGWGLRWPGEYHQYIVVLTGDDVRSSPVFSRLVTTPGTTAGRSTVWATQDGWLMSNGSNDTCWFAWGISQEAPMGAQRAFFSGMLFMTSTSPWGD